MSESLARRLSRLGSSGYIKVGGSRAPEGPWRELATTKPEDRPRRVSKDAATVGTTKSGR
jgi:hypothetical protein